MNTPTKTKMNVNVINAQTEAENPMQERHIGEVAESVEATAETIITEQKREVREGVGPVFVP